eukprot:jgi/Bigna1/77714/fgenesh1_pg.49_\
MTVSVALLSNLATFSALIRRKVAKEGDQDEDLSRFERVEKVFFLMFKSAIPEVTSWFCCLLLICCKSLGICLNVMEGDGRIRSLFTVLLTLVNPVHQFLITGFRLLEARFPFASLYMCAAKSEEKGLLFRAGFTRTREKRQQSCWICWEFRCSAFYGDRPQIFFLPEATQVQECDFRAPGRPLAFLPPGWACRMSPVREPEGRRGRSVYLILLAFCVAAFARSKYAARRGSAPTLSGMQQGFMEPKKRPIRLTKDVFQGKSMSVPRRRQSEDDGLVRNAKMVTLIGEDGKLTEIAKRHLSKIDMGQDDEDNDLIPKVDIEGVASFGPNGKVLMAVNGDPRVNDVPITLPEVMDGDTVERRLKLRLPDLRKLHIESGSVRVQIRLELRDEQKHAARRRRRMSFQDESSTDTTEEYMEAQRLHAEA